MLQTKTTNFPFSLVVSSLMLKRAACCQEVATTYRTRTTGCSRVTAQCNFGKHDVFAYCNGFQLKWKYVSNTCFWKRVLDNFTCSVRIDVSHQGRLVHKYCNYPKYFENKWKCIYFVTKYIRSLKTYELKHFTFRYSRRALSAAETRAGCALSRRWALDSAQCKLWEDLPS